MSLTGGLLVVLLWAAAIGLFALMVITPRSIGPGWMRMLRRAGYQLVVTFMVLLAVAVTFNEQYGWYANWADVGTVFTGTDPGHVVAAGAAAVQAAGASNGTGSGTEHHTVPLTDLPSLSELGLSAGNGPANGQVREYTVTGPISRVSSTVAVWYPPQYTEPSMTSHRFPVLEAFHGAPGTPRQLWYNMSLGTLLAQQARNGSIAPSVIVMPYYTPGKIDTECTDGGAGQPQIEQWLTRDVTNWVEHHLRVANDRTSWAAFGLSAGAWCANMLAMLHPDLFSAGVSLGGYYEPQFETRYTPFRRGTPQWDHYDLLALARDHPPKIALWVQTSSADTVSYGTTRQFLSAVKAPTSVTADILPNAGHRLSVWEALIPQTLKWLGKTAPGFATAPVLHLPGWVDQPTTSPGPAH